MIKRRYIALAAVVSAAGTTIAAIALAFWLTPVLPDNVFVVPADGQPMIRVEVTFPYPSDQGPLAHYTEHLTWMNAVGTADRTADHHTNAWTNSYTIGYWLTGSSADLPVLLRNLSAVFDPINLPADFAAQERDIVLREYDYRMADNPDAQAAVDLAAFLYDGNAIAGSVIGTPQQIMALDVDKARAFHAMTHQPEQAQLVVIGAISKRAVQRALREADWPVVQARAAAQSPDFTLAASAETQLRAPNPMAAPRLIWRRVVSLPAPVPFDLLEAQSAMLDTILNTSLPGGLEGPLRLDAHIARAIAVEVWPLSETTVEISIRAAPDSGVTLTTLQAAIETTLSDLAIAGIPDTTYHRVRDRFDGYWPDWSDSRETASWMASYVPERLSQRRAPLMPDALAQIHAAVTQDSTNALLRAFAGPGRTASAMIGPEDRFE